MTIKVFTGLLPGIMATLAVMVIGVFTIGPSMIIHEHQSPSGLEDTV
jgi:hypothetical protein